MLKADLLRDTAPYSKPPTANSRRPRHPVGPHRGSAPSLANRRDQALVRLGINTLPGKPHPQEGGDIPKLLVLLQATVGRSSSAFLNLVYLTLRLLGRGPYQPPQVDLRTAAA